MTTTFFRLLHADDKDAALRSAVDAAIAGVSADGVVNVAPRSFRQVPGSPFAYWVSDRTRRLFKELPPFEDEGRTVKQGLVTTDDFRFLRLWTEVGSLERLSADAGIGPSAMRLATTKGERWVPFVKIGGFTPFYGDFSLVVDWRDDGEELWSIYRDRREQVGGIIKNPDYYFRQGITWASRPFLRGSFSHVPSGAIFSHTGMMLFLPIENHWSICAMLNSKAFLGLLHLLMARGGDGGQTLKYEIGYVTAVPIPHITSDTTVQLQSLGIEGYSLCRSINTIIELSHVFCVPSIMQVAGKTVTDRIAGWSDQSGRILRKLNEVLTKIDNLAFQLYRIGPADRELMEKAFLSKDANVVGECEAAEDSVSVMQSVSGIQSLREMLSYAFGCVFGRWDIRLATGEKSPPELPDPFDPLPVCSPGMLQGADGLPLAIAPPNYPLGILWDGILVDDPDHPDDIVRRVRDALEVTFDKSVVRCPLPVEEEEPGTKDHGPRTTDAPQRTTDNGHRTSARIEQEACEIFGVADLRDYFRKPGAGGFWDDHVKRYSKSRRKAPIYWLLQSSKKNYALWIYYHRLDKDMLFKALLNYAEPKIRREDSRLGELRSHKAALGPAAKGAKKLDKDTERQEAFISELRDFEDKLRRAANLHLEPDLNDGVVLNIAPLHELVPWKEAKKYWEELLEGKYEWSAIGKQLREKGLVR